MIGAVYFLWLIAISAAPELTNDAVPACSNPNVALGCIYGVVWEDTTQKKRVPHATVSLYRGRLNLEKVDNDQPVGKTDMAQSDANGKFHFELVARASEYSLYAVKPGEPSSSIVSVTKFMFASNQRVTRDIFLSEAPR